MGAVNNNIASYGLGGETTGTSDKTRGAVGAYSALADASSDLAESILAQNPSPLSGVSDDSRHLIQSLFYSKDLGKFLIAQGGKKSATPLSKALCGTSFKPKTDTPLRVGDVRRIFREFSLDYRSPVSTDEMIPLVHKFLQSGLCEPKLEGGYRPVLSRDNPGVLRELAQGSTNVMRMVCDKHGINLHQAVSGFPSELATALKVLLNQLQDADLPAKMQTDEGFMTLTRLLGKYEQLANLRQLMLLPRFNIEDLRALSIQVGEDEDLTILTLDDEFKAEAKMMAAVEQNGLALQYVPDALRTPAMVTFAVEQNSLALQYVPDALKTKIITMAAVKQNQNR